MKQPCQCGLKCPYHHFSRDDDMICTYPYIRPDDDMDFGYPEDGNCGLMDLDTELYDILRAYDGSEKVRDLVQRENARLDIEDQKALEKLFDELFPDV